MQETQILISVIIPTYNRADWLKIAIESVLAQTYPHFELLILDNCSLDNTEDVVASFNDSRIKYVKHKCNIGTLGNWSYGIYWAKGHYLSILCDDDFYKPNFLFSCINAFNYYDNIQAVFSNYDLCDEQGMITSSSVAFVEKNAVINDKKLLLCVVKNLWFIGATLFKRDLVLQYWEESQRAINAVDTALKVKIALDKSNNVVWIKQPNLVHRQHSKQHSVLGGDSLLFDHIVAFNAPLMFKSYRWNYRRLLKRGEARAYVSLKKMLWSSGEIKIFYLYCMRQLAVFPYLPCLYSCLCYIKKLKRSFI